MDKLFQIKLNNVHEWSTYLKKKAVLGSGSFGTVFLVESLFNKKEYVLKEI